MAGRGRDPLPPEKIAAARKLLERGAIVGGRRVKLSGREIARRLGISHTVVQQVQAGTYGRPKVRPDESDGPLGVPIGRKLPRAARCGNGHLVNVLPCLTCGAGARRSISDAVSRDGRRNYRRRGRR